MSAARYTAMRRTMATANVTKVHYPTNIALNYNPLYSTIACNPRYEPFMYEDPPKCLPPCPSPPIPPPDICTSVFDGLYSEIIFCLPPIDGGPSNVINPKLFDGGNSTQSCIAFSKCLYFDGMFSRNNNLHVIEGLGARDGGLPIYNGGASQEVCPLPSSCIVYDSGYSTTVTNQVNEGGEASSNLFVNTGGSASTECVCFCPC